MTGVERVRKDVAEDTNSMAMYGNLWGCIGIRHTAYGIRHTAYGMGNLGTWEYLVVSSVLIPCPEVLVGIDHRPPALVLLVVVVEDGHGVEAFRTYQLVHLYTERYKR
jgi:hypothetical protein